MQSHNSLFSKSTLWASGVDKHLINLCSDGEVKKFETIGSMIFIPSILSFFSMFFLLSTYIYSVNILIPVISGLWAAIILLIDRGLVIGVGGIDQENSKINKYIGARLFLSFILSFVISHPITIEIFKDEISNKAGEIARTEFYGNNEIRKLESDIKTSEERLVIINKSIPAFISLKNHEIIGEKYSLEIEGIKFETKGEAGCSDNAQSCSNFKELIKTLSSEKKSIEEKLPKLQEKLDKLIAERNKTPSERKDLSSQTKALFYTAADNWLIAVVIITCFIFFISLDMLAILIKITTQTKQYNEIQSYLNSDLNYKSAIDEYYLFSEHNFYNSMINEKIKNNNINKQQESITKNKTSDELSEQNRGLSTSIDNSSNISNTNNSLSAGRDLVIASTNNFGINEVKKDMANGALGATLTYIALSLTGFLDNAAKSLDNLFKIKDHLNELIKLFCDFSSFC